MSQNLVKEFIRSRWPDYLGEPVFRFSFERMQFYSDLVFRISRATSSAPESVSQEILQELHKQGFDHSHIDNNYLYVGGLEEFEFEPSSVTPKSTTLFVAPSTKTVSPLASARLFACAYFQAALLRERGVSVVIALYDQVVQVPLEPQGLELLWHTLVTQRDVSESQVVQRIDNLQKIYERVALWLSPRTVSHKVFMSMCAKSDPAINDCWACCPEQQWLQHGEAPRLESFEAISLSLLCYLASDIRAVELDTAVPSLQESANLYWLLVSLKARLKKLTGAGTTDSEAICPELEELRKLLTLRPLFEHNAALYGDIRQYMDYGKYIAQRINLVCNSPVIRGKLHNGDLSRRDLDILGMLSPFISQVILPWEACLKELKHESAQ